MSLRPNGSEQTEVPAVESYKTDAIEPGGGEQMTLGISKF